MISPSDIRIWLVRTHDSCYLAALMQVFQARGQSVFAGACVQVFLAVIAGRDWLPQESEVRRGQESAGPRLLGGVTGVTDGRRRTWREGRQAKAAIDATRPMRGGSNGPLTCSHFPSVAKT